MHTHHDKTLGQFIRSAREAKTERAGEQKLQKSVARTALGISPQHLSDIEHDKTIPSLQLLFKLYEQLVDDKHATVLALWLNKWMAATAVRKTSLSPEVKEQMMEALRCLHGGLKSAADDWKPGAARTLKDFPHAFYPLKVVCGDRREDPPMYRGDIFASSLSSIDLTYLSRLGLRRDTKILTDKLFAVKDFDYLREQLSETNILVIGSPAGNFLARMINNGSVFRFDFTSEAKEFDRVLRSMEELNDRTMLRVFWQMVQSQSDIETGDYRNFGLSAEQVERLAKAVRRLLGGKTAEEVTDMYRKAGLVDTAHAVLRAHKIGESTDYGLISLARNPFAASTDYVCVFVAGVHGPGTSKGLKALCDPGNFERHPLGGILRVDLEDMRAWPERVEKSKWQWVVQDGYEVEKPLKNLGDALRGRRPGGAFSNWTDEEIRDCMEFVKDVIRRKDEPEPHAPAGGRAKARG